MHSLASLRNLLHALTLLLLRSTRLLWLRSKTTRVMYSRRIFGSAKLKSDLMLVVVVVVVVKLV